MEHKLRWDGKGENWILVGFTKDGGEDLLGEQTKSKQVRFCVLSTPALQNHSWLKDSVEGFPSSGDTV